MAEKLIDELNEKKLEQVDRLLRHGVNPNEVLQEQGVSPMHIAAGLGIKPVCLLLQHGGDPNVRLPDGTTPLHVASMWGDADCVQILLSNGGDPYIRDQEGLSAMDFAREYNNVEVVEAIKKYMFLLTATDEEAKTPKYTRKSLESNNADSLDVTNDETYENLNLDQYLQEFAGRRRSSVYLNCVQRQIDKYFGEGQKTHVVDVTSPDHLFIEPKHCARTPTPSPEVVSSEKNDTEESLCLHLSSSDSDESTCTDSFVTCNGEDLDTVIKMSSLQHTTTDDRNPIRKNGENIMRGLPKKSCLKSSRRDMKYCRRLPMLPSDTQELFEDNNKCEYCGCDVKNGASGQQTVCSTCERLGLELEELSLKTDMAGDSCINRETGKASGNKMNTGTVDDTHSNRATLTNGYHDKGMITDRTINTNYQDKYSGKSVNQNYRGSAALQKDSLHDLDKCFIQSAISDDSLISQDESFLCQRLQKSEFHPSDISTITVSDDSQDNAFIQSDSRNSTGRNNVTLKSKDGSNRTLTHTPGNQNNNYHADSYEGSTIGYNTQDNAFLQSGSMKCDNYSSSSDNIGTSVGVSKQTDKFTDYCQPNFKHVNDEHGIMDEQESNLSPKVIDDLWTEVRASAMKAKRARDTRRLLDTAFIGRGSMTSGVSETSTVSYVYTDKEHGIVLVERHFPPVCGSAGSRRSLDSLFTVDISPKGNKSTHNSSASSDDTISYDWKEHAMIRESSDSGNGESLPNSQPLSQELLQLNDEQIKSKLQQYHDDPGPINASTRQVYLRRLSSLQRDPTASWLTKKGPDYPPELRMALNGKLDLTDCPGVESKMVEAFQNPNRLRRWREGTLKSSFNYLLLDPRITDNLPNRADNMDDLDIFRTFISAIFYVGKGKRARPYCHLLEAIKQMKKPNGKVSKKVEKILDIWSGDMGVVSLHCFQSVIPVEAYTREACMVDAIGLNNLTNMKRGDYYGVSATYSIKQQRRVGIYLLKKALQIFLAEGERQISAQDIKNDP